MNLSRKNRARMAWATSFFKSRWRFEDYPLDYIDQGEGSPNLAEKLRHPRWRADVVNWYSVSGMGETKESALADAKQKFASWEASGEKIWRPGTGPGIVFASKQAIDRYPELRDDFIHKVLRLEWAYISDESSLWDFHEDVTNDKYYARIMEVYGVDVSDIDSGNLVAILERISTHREID
jgi:hypothetical protein